MTAEQGKKVSDLFYLISQLLITANANIEYKELKKKLQPTSSKPIVNKFFNACIKKLSHALPCQVVWSK